MIRINLLEHQWPKDIRELDAALKEFNEEYERATKAGMEMYVKPPSYFMMTKEESNLRLLGYDEEADLLTSSVDTKTDSSSNSNSSTPSIEE